MPLNFDRVADWGKETRDLVGDGGGGLEVYVTGDLGLWADFEEVFGEVDTRLLLATVLLVLVLLGAIYRAPLIAIIPIVVVGLAYQVATAFIYLYADAGNTVNSNSTGILVVLMFGVGTDYCLLLVSRYREELHRVEDKHAAMARALRRAGPGAPGERLHRDRRDARVAAGGHRVNQVARAGVGYRRGVCAARRADAAAGPADRGRPRASGRAARPSPTSRTSTSRSGRGSGGASAIACCSARDSRSQRRRRCSRVFTLGLFAYKEDYSIGGFFKKDVESVEGFDVLAESFPQGALAPTSILVLRDDGGPRPPTPISPRCAGVWRASTASRRSASRNAPRTGRSGGSRSPSTTIPIRRRRSRAWTRCATDCATSGRSHGTGRRGQRRAAGLQRCRRTATSV